MARKPPSKMSVGMLAYKALYGTVSVEELTKLQSKGKCPSERAEHLLLMEWARLQPEVNAYLFHIPNGEKREAHTGSLLKALGVKPGIPDLMLALPNGRYAGLFIELKRKKGYSISLHQEEWIKKLNEVGYKAVFAYGAEDAIRQVEEYMREYRLNPIEGSRFGDRIGVNR